MTTRKNIKKGDAYAALEPYGWYFEDEEKMILDGTHELYTKTKEP